MTDRFPLLHRLAAPVAALALCCVAATAQTGPQHGIAMYGEPALPPDFVSLPYVNPQAPKGGRIVFGEVGGFDSLNPHILKGNAPWGVQSHVFEGLMGRSWDEPFTLYGLLAETVETGPNREWVEFTLRPEARFSDGSPVTVEDVIWSHTILGTEGHPRFHAAWQKVDRLEQTGPRSVRITFNTPDRELPLIMGLRPIFQKAQWDGRDFAASSMTAPVATGPYVIDAAEPGRSLVLRRNPEYWGRDLPFARGQYNLDEIRYEYFADSGVMFEAFKAGEITSFRETDAARWEEGYDFDAVTSGRIVRAEIPHERPTGISGLVFNTRSPVFTDWRVRDALLHAFNYTFIAQTQTGGADPRIPSFFGNSVLAMREGPAEGRVRALLEPFADDLLPGALDGYALPEGDGTARNRKGIRTAMQQLEAAGWTPKDGVMSDANGTPLTFEILLRQGSAQEQAIVNIFAEALERLGIRPEITTIDSAQYVERTNLYDFDMAFYRRALSLSPGNEQILYWGAQGVTEPGSRNWMGMDSPAAEAMIDTMLNARTAEEFTAAVRALDRVLTTGRYVIPLWYSAASRLAYRAELHFPDRLPLYGDWSGFQPDVWWWED
ncbi:ABC transporter substrate-binding protein [Meridianimarinicoccus roseus]|uniref:ABC transporter substrate-binding protein n=1 Tax=Meridianimarinicoccus roseus TaxID=2072018 RepID=A0A2V2LD36_9RHOB|nr:extracellular solute-binding protein [Meridianimarinicoccus roseus]PWR03418.1 ABC transporter substrate-binding protein [Meridianimarinicoccus roseus]